MKVHKNNKGFSLLTVIVVMSVLSILGVTTLAISLSETRQTVYQQKKMQAYYLAKSGADMVSSYILKNPSQAVKLLAAPESNLNNQLAIGSFNVDVVPTADTNEIKVNAKGYVGDIQNATSVIMRSLKLNEMLDRAIYTNADLNIQAMTVTGDIQSGGQILWGENYEGKAYPYQPRTIEFVNPFPSAGAAIREVKKSVLEIGISTNFNKLSIANNGIVNITTSGSDIELVVNDLDIKGILNINATGGGSVKIYVNNNMTVTTQGLVNNTESKNLFVFLKKDSMFEIQAGMVLNGYIIGPEATVQIQSPQSTINGAIFSNIVQKNVNQGGHGTVNYVPLPAGDEVGATMAEYRILRWEQ